MDDKPTTAILSSAKAIGVAAGAQAAESVNNSTSLFADLLVLNWANIASALAAFYVLCQLCNWWWKKFWRPLFERRGWIKPKPRLVLTPKEWAARIAEQDSDNVPLA